MLLLLSTEGLGIIETRGKYLKSITNQNWKKGKKKAKKMHSI